MTKEERVVIEQVLEALVHDHSYDKTKQVRAIVALRMLLKQHKQC